MENTFKALWSERQQMYVHFDLSPLTDEVIWGYSLMPQLMGYETTMEMLYMYIGEGASTMPEGVEMKTVQLSFLQESEVIEEQNIENE
jgi:hypothetical protein